MAVRTPARPGAGRCGPSGWTCPSGAASARSRTDRPTPAEQLVVRRALDVRGCLASACRRRRRNRSRGLRSHHSLSLKYRRKGHTGAAHVAVPFTSPACSSRKKATSSTHRSCRTTCPTPPATPAGPQQSEVVAQVVGERPLVGGSAARQVGPGHLLGDQRVQRLAGEVWMAVQQVHHLGQLALFHRRPVTWLRSATWPR